MLHRSFPFKARAGTTILAGALGLLAVVSTAAAHDFWVIPDMFAYAADTVVRASGRSGTRFPSGTAVHPERVADARFIGERGAWKITDLTVEGNSLRLSQKPTSPGQYLIAVSLTARTTRSVPAGLLRFLRLEGGASEADRLERENVLTGTDSLEYRATSYGFAIVQVGRGGGRAYAASAGFPLEFMPVSDPAHLRVGETLHVKVMGGGKAMPLIGVFAGAAADSAATAPAGSPQSQSLSHVADAMGIVHVPLHAAGAWNLRAAYVSRRADGGNAWDVARATYVFGVAGR